MKRPLWSTVRRLLQILFWCAFIALIFSLRFPVGPTAPYTFIPRLSAYLGITVSIAAGKALTVFLPALILMALTLVFGRFFCGCICPMGNTIDGTDPLFRKKQRPPARDGKTGRSLKGTKYAVLLVSILCAAGGIQFAGLIDPLSVAMRSYGTALYPYTDSLIRTVSGSLYHVPVVSGISEPVFELLKEHVLDLKSVTFRGHIWIFMIFFGIIGLSVCARRFWCRYLCPFGALQGLVSGTALFRRTVDEAKCVHCGVCVRDCRMNAIAGDGILTAESECIKCFECLKSCNYNAISFSFTIPRLFTGRYKTSSPKSPSPPRGAVTRRGFVTSILASAILVPLFRLRADAKGASTYLIRPPGAMPEEDFTDRCIRCGECMKVCPTNGLHPVLTESGLEGIFTPRLIPRIGWCEKNCNLCTTICPTGAIGKVEIPAKETLIIGTACINRSLCIPWARGKECIVCEEMCPTATKSIILREETIITAEGRESRVKLPHVREDICIGCGICENKCPVPGNAAIRVRAPLHAADSFGSDDGY